MPVSRVVDTANDSPAPLVVLCCDFNSNGRVDAGDIEFVAAHWGQANSPYDYDGSNAVDAADLMFVVDHWRKAGQ